MKWFSCILLIVFLILFSGCEKEIVNENEKGKTEEATIVDEDEKDEALTIAEAQLVEDGTPILVKAYIVASTTRSIKNADFEKPFSGSSAIVLGDKPVEEETIYYVDEVFPVCLTDRSKARAALNLEDNPDNWNHLIYIYGVKEHYMNMDGMKKVDYWEIIP